MKKLIWICMILCSSTLFSSQLSDIVKIREEKNEGVTINTYSVSQDDYDNQGTYFRTFECEDPYYRKYKIFIGRKMTEDGYGSYDHAKNRFLKKIESK